MWGSRGINLLHAVAIGTHHPHLKDPLATRAPHGSSKGADFRLDIYGSILCLFDIFNTAHTATNNGVGNSSNGQGQQTQSRHHLSQMTERERNRDEAWGQIFPAMTAQVVAAITSDISYAPDSLKVGPWIPTLVNRSLSKFRWWLRRYSARLYVRIATEAGRSLRSSSTAAPSAAF